MNGERIKALCMELFLKYGNREFMITYGNEWAMIEQGYIQNLTPFLFPKRAKLTNKALKLIGENHEH